MQVIQLDDTDDIVSINDRLDWQQAQQVLLVLPVDGGVLREGLDLVRLRRHADRRRIEVGLVTSDVEIGRQARALGFPTFTTVEMGQKGRRSWWRGRRRQEQIGLPTVGGWHLPPRPMDGGDRAEMHRRLTPTSRLRRWLWRYAAILLFFVTIALLFVGFSYAVPRATVVLKPQIIPVTVTQQVVADPQLSEEAAGAGVSGRLLTVVASWQADVETTGTATVPNASARGQVVFVNQVAQAVEVPVGTRVSTSDGSNIVFQTTEAATVAGVVGSTAEVDVVAVEPGPQANVAANLVNRVEGSLALQLEVRNLAPMTGGGVRETAVVTQADQDRLRSQVLQFIQAVARSEMEAQLTEREFLAAGSLRVATVYDETYSHFVGEQTNLLTLEMQVEVQGTAVDTTKAAGLVYDALVAQVPVGFTLVPDSILFEAGDVVGVDEAGRITFEMKGEGVVSADLDLTQPVGAITGQPPEVAVAYLYESLPLRDVPMVDIWPTWFDRMPYLPVRIQTTVQTSE